MATLPTWLRAASESHLESPDVKVDVLVIGGGTAGTVAAIQAARAGARTMLVEMGSQLGGATTTGGVTAVQLFHAWGRQVIAGIGWELISRAVELDGAKLPDFSRIPSSGGTPVGVNGPLYAAVAEEACIGTGVTLAYYELPLSVRSAAGGWEVATVGKGLRRTIHCRQLIDCTGGADIVGLIGLPRLRETEMQPGTLRFVLGGYETAKLDAKEIEKRYQQALRDGILKEGDYCYANRPFMDFLKAGGSNLQHIFGADSSTSATMTQANIAGRTSILRLLRFIRTLPGGAGVKVLKMQPETAVRETYRIIGEVLITRQDYESGRVFDDAVGYSFYPIDVHDREGVEPQPLKRGVVPTIPLRALVPKGSQNLMVAGRSISSDRAANSALRVQASCMAMGQAAGAAAALACRKQVSPLQVPIAEIRALLSQHGAILQT
ncbi:MAG: FAD-dependent oxidoreductase [Verrucomicrobiota bacterium]